MTFRDYKGHDSTNLLALSGAKQHFIMVDIGAPGRHSDGGVFANSEMGKRFQNNEMFVPRREKLTERGPELPYVMVGDEAFALSSSMMKPYPRRNCLNLKERVFNYRLSRARRIVETSFGILSAVWRIFKSPLRTNLATTIQVIKACVCLHNFILKFDPNRERIINMSNSAEARENCFETIPASLRNNGENLVGPAQDRDEFANYFLTEGAITFQWDKALNAEF